MKTKTFLASVVGVVALVAVVAFAATPKTRAIPHISPESFQNSLYIGPSSANPAAINGILPFSATIDFASAYRGIQYSSAITVNGAEVNDSCTLAPPAAAAALKGAFGCVVTATNTVKAWFAPMDVTMGTVALSSGTPSTATATVVASSICECTPVGATAGIAAAGCATGVSSTTLTLTGPNTVTTTMVYDCAAPVDPASGTFEGYVVKH